MFRSSNSFAIVLWEIAMQKTPYEDLKDNEELIKHVLNGERPKLEMVIENTIPHKYTRVMKKAWNTEPYDRLSAEDMHKELAKCLKDDYSIPISNTRLNVKYHNMAEISDSDDDSTFIIRDDVSAIEKSFNDAINYHMGKHYENAWPIFKQLAIKGHREAIFYLAYYYHHGYIVEKDRSKALKYYRKSASLGCCDAEYNYALLCLADASEYMKKAAEHGYLKASTKYVELQLARISWLSIKKSNESELLEYLQKEESLIANCETEDKSALATKINKLREKIEKSQPSTES
jgi:hypothetical protein